MIDIVFVITLTRFQNLELAFRRVGIEIKILRGDRALAADEYEIFRSGFINIAIKCFVCFKEDFDIRSYPLT